MTGTIEAIWLRPAARSPVEAVTHATAIADQGLAGDHAFGGRRQITILSREAWDSACHTFGSALDPRFRRANVMIAGVDLAAAIGCELHLGLVRVAITGETRPCELMDDHGHLGLQAALRKGQRGGVYGRILNGGELRIGMTCRVIAKPMAGKEPLSPTQPQSL
jgi:MOSC domain-containing protein YiiM